jgi:hypothetical protein
MSSSGPADNGADSFGHSPELGTPGAASGASGTFSTASGSEAGVSAESGSQVSSVAIVSRRESLLDVSEGGETRARYLKLCDKLNLADETKTTGWQILCTVQGQKQGHLRLERGKEVCSALLRTIVSSHALCSAVTHALLLVT